MDMIITVIGWIIGLYVAFILILAIGFSAGGAANKKNSDLTIMSIGSTFLLFYLIYKGFTFFFGSDDIDVNERKAPIPVKTIQRDTTAVDVTEATPPTTQPVTETKPTPTQTKSIPVTLKETAKAKKGYFDDAPYIPWMIYALVFLFYLFWIFKPSKEEQAEKELVKKKLIATMMFQKDATGLQAWHPDWKPDDHL